MNVLKVWVFPILRLLLFAAVAIALVKIAFFPDVALESNPAVPGAEIIEPVVEASIGTVRNDVVLDGTIEPVAAVSIPATLSGEVTKVYATQGQAVSEGDKIVQLRSEGVNDNGDPHTRWATITAPTSGILTTLSALSGQQFSIGDALGKVSPPVFIVSGTVPPEQLYRLIEQPADAQVAVNGGPAPFTCTGLQISAAVAAGGEGSTASGPRLTCTVPSDVRVFAGLTAEIVIAGGISENVLTIPMTAVEGAAESGNVYLSLPDGSTEVRAVKLGLNDGTMVEVLDGLEEGDLILQFVPGAQSPDIPTEGCYFDEFGNEFCEG
ncbi:MAG: efflux RND transporter periplasmic adaptor subunit [Microbacteriaceae bacterium]